MNQEQFIREVFDVMPQLIRFNRWLQQNHAFENDYMLPPAQMHAVIMIKKHAPLNMTQLAKYLMMPRQQLTRIIDALVEKELVERKTDPANRRYVMIELSQQGEEYIKERLYHAHGSISRLTETLTEQQQQKLFGAIRQMQEVFDEIDIEAKQ